MLSEVEQMLPPEPEVSAKKTCGEKPVGSSCWMALANHPECYIWNPGLAKDETGTWSGECSGGFVQGKEHASKIR